MAKIDIALQMLREQFTLALEEAFAEKFDGKKIETEWNIIYERYVSTPERCGSDWADRYAFEFTPEMQAFIAGFETAWLKASNVVAEER